ncbi:MAG: YdbL family protein [Sphingomonas sp.]
MKLAAWIAAWLLGATGAAAFAQSLIAPAIQGGQVGERYDGYMGFPAPASVDLKRQVAAINLRRRNLYLELASRRNVTAQVVGIAAGCELLRQLQPGEPYMLADGVWRRWVPGQPAPVPDHCR